MTLLKHAMMAPILAAMSLMTAEAATVTFSGQLEEDSRTSASELEFEGEITFDVTGYTGSGSENFDLTGLGIRFFNDAGTQVADYAFSDAESFSLNRVRVIDGTLDAFFFFSDRRSGPFGSITFGKRSIDPSDPSRAATELFVNDLDIFRVPFILGFIDFETSTDSRIALPASVVDPGNEIPVPGAALLFMSGGVLAAWRSWRR
ncbi:MAG: hypothetical protein AAFR65_08175 [Pseudomonadota bacterium]